MVSNLPSSRKGYIFLKEWLAELGIKQTELAKRLDVERGTVSKYLKPEEQHRITVYKQQRIADCLGIPVGALWHSPREFPSYELQLLKSKMLARYPTPTKKKPRRPTSPAR